MAKCHFRQNAGSRACGAPAQWVANVLLCEEHDKIMFSRRGATARQSALYHPPETFPGWCYLARVRWEGKIKIGYSNTDEFLKNRITNLRSTHRKAELLAQLPGGFIMESVLHYRFLDLRVPYSQELFEPGQRLMDFIAEAGGTVRVPESSTGATWALGW